MSVLFLWGDLDGIRKHLLQGSLKIRRHYSRDRKEQCYKLRNIPILSVILGPSHLKKGHITKSYKQTYSARKQYLKGGWIARMFDYHVYVSWVLSPFLVSQYSLCMSLPQRVKPSSQLSDFEWTTLDRQQPARHASSEINQQCWTERFHPMVVKQLLLLKF